jgi:hypothetical protein
MAGPEAPAAPVATTIAEIPSGAATRRVSRGLRWSRNVSVGPLPSAGGAEIDIGPVPAGRHWEVRRIAVWATTSAPSPGPCALYVGPTVAEVWFVDGTTTGQGDIWSDATPLVVPGGDLLILQWAGYAAGDVCWCRLLFEDVEYLPEPRS